jgi:predicted dehydrogenase
VDRLRVGTLGAARITPAALIKPARQVPEMTVTAVAARDPARAREFAAKHGIAVVHDSYEALIADPEIDAVYNPLPNSLHAPWTLRAIAAGKHVLCEKPFTSNEAEAQEVAAAAKSAGLVVVEAFHYRYHPLARRMLDAVAEIGKLRHVEAAVAFPLPRFSAGYARNASTERSKGRNDQSVTKLSAAPPCGPGKALSSPFSCSSGAGPTISGSGHPTTSSSLSW